MARNAVRSDSREAAVLDAPAAPASVSLRFDPTRVTAHRERSFSRDSLMAALEGSVIVAATDASGTITEANNAFCRISGYSRAELVGANHRILNSGHHPKGFWAQMWKTVASGQTWRAEVCNKAKSGALYWLDTTIAPVRDDTGRINGYVSTRVDITERKAGELAKSLHREAMATLTGGIAHEFNSILLAAATYLQTVQTGPGGADAPVRKAAVLIQQAQSLSASLLELFAGPQLVQQPTLSIRGWLPECVRQLAELLHADSTVELAPIRADLLVRADPLALEQVLRILITNAADALAGPGDISISASRAAGPDGKARGGADVEILVSDNGPGIRPEDRDRVFEPFFTTRKRSRRSGLGLAIASRLVQQAGGSLSFRPHQPNGSTFVVRLRSASEATQ